MKRFLLSVLVTVSALAAPDKLEVWYLSNAKVSQVSELLKQPHYILYKPVAELQCQPMGDLCFDPQYGLYKKDDIDHTVSADKVSENKGPSIPTAKSLDRDLINCDKSNYFDIFCGKAKNQPVTKPQIEIWVDTSSSMREFDFSDKEGGCNRKSFISRLDESCALGSKLNVMMFDVSIKQMGSLDSLCNNQGLNDYKRLMDWIERSDAKKLIVITDKYELHKEFADYIESKHGVIRGDTDPMTSSAMLNTVDDLAKSCK